MDREKLIKSDAYWSSKLNTLLYHKNYKGTDKRKVLISELLTLKNELIGLCESQNLISEPDKALNLQRVINCPLCGGEMAFVHPENCMTEGCPNCVF